MGEQQPVAKRLPARAHARIGRDAGEAVEALAIVTREGPRYQRRPALDDAQAGLSRDLVPEGSRADLRDRESPARDDERLRAIGAACRVDIEGAIDSTDRATRLNADARVRAFGE